MKLETKWRRFGAMLAALVLSCFGANLSIAQSPNAKSGETAALNGDRMGELQLAAARKNPLQLRQFLKKMPKGADLHYHLSGGVYAESFIRAAVEDGLCVDTRKFAFTKCSPEGDADKSIVPAGDAYRNQSLYDQLINSFSMRSFVPYASVSGHDHFFDTFAKFGGTNASHKPEWVDEVAARAAAQNEQYLELMNTPDAAFAVIGAAKPVAPGTGYAAWRQQLLHAGLGQQAAAIRQQMDQAEQARRRMEHCDGPQPAPACAVDVRYLYQVLRNMPPPAVFAQLLLGFEVAAGDLGSP